MQWDQFFSGAAGYAGVLFAIVLVARELDEHGRSNETDAQNRTRLWDSMSVTFELGAAAILSILYFIRGSVLDVIGASLIVATGIGLAIKYLLVYSRLEKEHRSPITRASAWFTVLPIAALIASLLSYAWWWIDRATAQLLLGGGVGWLLLSGTAQTLVWYYTSWERPRSPSTMATSQSALSQTTPEPGTPGPSPRRGC